MEHLKKPPFSVERNTQRSLSAQMADGLRSAILTGFYKEGEILPKVLEWAQMLGVSIRVPEAAMAALVREGLVVTRRGVGCVVRPRTSSIWRGHVLLVSPDAPTVYTASIVTGRVRAALSRSGWLVSQIDVPGIPGVGLDLSRLEFALKHPVELAIVVMGHPKVEAYLSQSGTPFVVYGRQPCSLPHCAGNILLDLAAAAPAFARHCAMVGASRIVQVTMAKSFDASEALRKAGADVENWVLPNPRGLHPEAIARMAVDAFRERLAGGRGWLPDVLFFADDYIASGAMVALLHEGVRIPEDVRLASLYNKGLGPVAWDTIARWELDSHAAGDAAAGRILAWLDGNRRRPVFCAVGTVYHSGATFP